jgi:hypothetical protein
MPPTPSPTGTACVGQPGFKKSLNELLSVTNVSLGALTDYLFFFSDASTDAKWIGSRGFVGDVAINGLVANEGTSGTIPYNGTIFTNAGTQGAWQGILDDNVGQSSGSVNQAALISNLTATFNNAILTINALSPNYSFLDCNSLNNLNTTNGVPTITVIDMSETQCTAQPNIFGDSSDVFIIRWTGPEIKFQSGGAIVPKGGLTPANFINVAKVIKSSGGGTTPPPPYPQGPRLNNGNGTLITGGSDWPSGGFFTGYWLTTGMAQHSQCVIVGGWYSNTTDFSWSGGSGAVHIEPNVCQP